MREETPERTILLVDDEPAILSSLQRLLRGEQYRIFTAGSAEEGLAVLKEHPVQLVVADYILPKLNGSDFLKLVKQQYPDAVRVMISGFLDVAVLVDLVNQVEVYRFVAKPWQDDEFKTLVSDSLEYHDTQLAVRVQEQQAREQIEALQQRSSALEMKVADLSGMLRLSQEVLEAIPAGLIGVSPDYELMLSNGRTFELIPALAGQTLGTKIDSLLPEQIVAAIDGVFTGNRCDEPVACTDSGNTIVVKASALGAAEDRRGCVLLVTAATESVS